MLPKKIPQLNAEQWNAAIADLPGAHILQTWEWGRVKSEFGWQPHYLLVMIVPIWKKNYIDLFGNGLLHPKWRHKK